MVLYLAPAPVHTVVKHGLIQIRILELKLALLNAFRVSNDMGALWKISLTALLLLPDDSQQQPRDIDCDAKMTSSTSADFDESQ
jgi:hypothetical protein